MLLTPAAWSLLADYFTADKLARPVSFFLMGPYLGGGLALAIFYALGSRATGLPRGTEAPEINAVDWLNTPAAPTLSPFPFLRRGTDGRSPRPNRA